MEKLFSQNNFQPDLKIKKLDARAKLMLYKKLMSTRPEFISVCKDLFGAGDSLDFQIDDMNINITHINNKYNICVCDGNFRTTLFDGRRARALYEHAKQFCR